MILTRRNFFLSAAIIPAASLMPGHSIATLLKPAPRKFWTIFVDPMCLAFKDMPPMVWGVIGEPAHLFGQSTTGRKIVRLTPDEISAYRSGRMRTGIWCEHRKVVDLRTRTALLRPA